MIETAEALTGLTAIAQAGQTASVPLECLVVGTNDIAKETGVSTGAGRMYLLPWLMDIVLAAKRHGLVVLDGVWNDFKDMSGFDDEVRQGKGMGFDGKTLIHPTQIDLTNSVFAPTAREIADAHAVVAAFARPENAGAGVINLEGRMVELLHLEMARRTLSLETAIRAAQSA
jgi:citrate lyase subunit beta/citryl-CoA lyase